MLRTSVDRGAHRGNLLDYWVFRIVFYSNYYLNVFRLQRFLNFGKSTLKSGQPGGDPEREREAQRAESVQSTELDTVLFITGKSGKSLKHPRFYT